MRAGSRQAPRRRSGGGLLLMTAGVVAGLLIFAFALTGGLNILTGGTAASEEKYYFSGAAGASGAVSPAADLFFRREAARADWTEIPVVAHALGTVEGRKETNSREAFLESYAAGQRVFEVDLQLTSDGKLIARHDWDQMSYYNLEQVYVGVMDWETFMATPICFCYTPLDIDGLLRLMRIFPDCYIVTDSKDTDEATVRAQTQALVQAVDRTGDPSLWDRVIIQIYHEEMYDWVKEEAPVTNWIFTLYQLANPDYEEIGAFCQERNIAVVTMNASRISSENSSVLRQYGRKIYLHTVNRLLEMKAIGSQADGYYSDYVTPRQLKDVLAQNP